MEETIRIERMSHGPEAVGHLSSGKAVFVEGGAPGDVATIEVIEERPRFARARILRLDEASSRRVKPRWTEEGAQDSCPWQHLDYEAQLEAKRANVAAALERTAGLRPQRVEPLVRACLPSKRQWGYRNKAELVAGFGRDGAFELGSRREADGHVESFDSCPLAHDAIAGAPKALRGALRFAQGSADLGVFRVGVRHSLRTGDLEVALWTRPGPFPRAHLAQTLGSALKATSLVRVLAEPGRARAAKGVEALAGKGCWDERLASASFLTSAPSFFQVNTAQAEKLVAAVLEALGAGGGPSGPQGLGGMAVADLYAGGGTFSVPLAQAGARVVAVEAAGPSVRDLRRNAERNAVDVEVVGGDAARELAGLGRLDAIVVDPPRSGLLPAMIEQIAQAGPGLFVYVSCNPATWARDVARLEARSFELADVQPVDLFPQTYHVEVLSVFKRATPAGPPSPPQEKEKE